MKRFLSIVLLISCGSILNAQLVYKDVAGIFYKRCTSCHHEGANNYSFMSYSKTKPFVSSIMVDLNIGKMPPWNADTLYTRFQHERIITASEKTKILNWITQGALAGDTTQAPPPPIYNNNYQLIGTPDLILGIGQFTSTATSADKYYCFSIPSTLTQDRVLRAFEIVPGNKAIVHHAVITADTTGAYTSDLSGNCFNIPGNLGIGTFAPGTAATVLPGDLPIRAGIVLKAGSKIIIQMHYPKGSAGQVDSTKIRMFFYPQNVTNYRRVYVTTPLQNWSMIINANTTPTYSAYYPSASTNLTGSISAYAMMPHSHLICKSILNYAYIPGVDTIKLVRINNWDFHWQDYYTFKKLVKIPAGYRLYSRHSFDNTSSNPHNPFSPPQTILAGTSTDSEMLFDGLMFMTYQPGDELVDLEAMLGTDSLLVGVKPNQLSTRKTTVTIFPNPFKETITFRMPLNQSSDVELFIYDVIGKLVYTKKLIGQTENLIEWQWNGRNAKGEELPKGLYLYKVKTNHYLSENKFLKE